MSAMTMEKLMAAMASLGPLHAPNLGRIVESALCADQVFDFSQCRSPARAARRLKRGIRGRVSVTWVPWEHAYRLPDGAIVMHPDKAAQLRRWAAGQR